MRILTAVATHLKGNIHVGFYKNDFVVVCCHQTAVCVATSVCVSPGAIVLLRKQRRDKRTMINFSPNNPVSLIRV